MPGSRAVSRGRPAADNVPPTARRRRPTYDRSGGRPSALGRDSSRAQNDPMRFIVDDLTSVQHRAAPTRPNTLTTCGALRFTGRAPPHAQEVIAKYAPPTLSSALTNLHSSRHVTARLLVFCGARSISKSVQYSIASVKTAI